MSSKQIDAKQDITLGKISGSQSKSNNFAAAVRVRIFFQLYYNVDKWLQQKSNVVYVHNIAHEYMLKYSSAKTRANERPGTKEQVDAVRITNDPMQNLTRVRQNPRGQGPSCGTVTK